MLAGFHQFGGLGRIRRIQKFCHNQGELFELNWLCDIGVEASLNALGVHIAKDVGRKSDDRMTTITVLLFPLSNLFTGLVPVFVGHMEIALANR